MATATAKQFTVKPGDEVTFKGCMWDDGWEFDAPAVIYSPVKKFGDGGSIPTHLESMVEDICIGLCVDGGVRRDWHATDLKEFKWRRWSPTGFARRRCWHMEIDVQFFEGKDGLEFEILAARKILKK